MDVDEFVVVDAVLAFVLEDVFAVTDVRLLLLLLSILSELKIKIKKNIQFNIKDF